MKVVYNYIFEFEIVSRTEANFSACRDETEENDFLKDMCHWEITEMFVSWEYFDV